MQRIYKGAGVASEIGKLREHYASLSDGELLSIYDGVDMTETALRIIRKEMHTRDILPEESPEGLEQRFGRARAARYRGTEPPPLPRMAPGFVIAAFYLGSGFLEAAPGHPRTLGALLFFIGIIYWLVCVNRIHHVLRHISEGSYRISPLVAVVLHLVPYVNLAWFLAWPTALALYLRRGWNVETVPGPAIGLGILGAFLSGWLYGVDGSLVLAMIFGITGYLTEKVRLAVVARSRRGG